MNLKFVAVLLISMVPISGYAQSSGGSYHDMVDDVFAGRVDSHLSNLTTNAATYALAFEFRDALFERCGLILPPTGLPGGVDALPLHRNELLQLAMLYHWMASLESSGRRAGLGDAVAATLLQQIYSSLPVKLHRDAILRDREELVEKTLSRFGGCSDKRVLALATNLTRLALWQRVISERRQPMVDAINTGEGILFCSYYDDPSSSSAYRQRYNVYVPGMFNTQYAMIFSGIMMDKTLARPGCPSDPDPDYPMEAAYRQPTFDMSTNTGDTVAERLANFFLDQYLPSQRDQLRGWWPSAEELEEGRQIIVAYESIPIEDGAAYAEAEREIRGYIERGEERFQDQTNPHWRDPAAPDRLCVIDGRLRFRAYYPDGVQDVIDIPFLLRRYTFSRCGREFVQIRMQG